MSFKQLNNLYNESVAGREYQRNRDTLLLELTLNEKTAKAVADKYLNFEFNFNGKDPETSKYLTSPDELNNLLFNFCKERSIFLRTIDVTSGVDEERIKTQKFRRVLYALSHLVEDINWTELRLLNSELAMYMLDFTKFIPDIWEEDGGMQVSLEEAAIGNLSLWSFLPYQTNKDNLLIRIRHEYVRILARALIRIFNKRQQILPNKDIFAYPNLFELCKAIATTRSKAELNTVSADIENTIKEIKAAIMPNNNKNWIVVKPPSHAFSKKYFGITRYSIKDILKIANRAEKDPANRDQILNEIGNLHKTKGSNWCTAANSADHWNLYTQEQKTELYYFISVQADKDNELYAMRTIGSCAKAGRGLADYNTPVSESVIYSLSAALRFVIGNRKAQDFVDLAVIPKGLPTGSNSWARLTPKDNLAVLLNYLYHNMFSSYLDVSVIEMRDQQNEAIQSGDEANDFTIEFDDDWLKANINYIAGIPSMSEEEATKAALNICMQKRQNTPTNPGQMGSRPSST